MPPKPDSLTNEQLIERYERLLEEYKKSSDDYWLSHPDYAEGFKHYREIERQIKELPYLNALFPKLASGNNHESYWARGEPSNGFQILQLMQLKPLIEAWENPKTRPILDKYYESTLHYKSSLDKYKIEKQFSAQIDRNSSVSDLMNYLKLNEASIDNAFSQRLLDRTHRPANFSDADMAEYAELMLWKTVYHRFFEDHNPKFLREMSQKYHNQKRVYENRIMKGYKDRGGEEGN